MSKEISKLSEQEFLSTNFEDESANVEAVFNALLSISDKEDFFSHLKNLIKDDVKFNNKQLQKLLVKSIYLKDISSVELLLSLGVNPHFYGQEFELPISILCYRDEDYDSIEILKLILSSNPESFLPDYVDPMQDAFPLQVALRNDNFQMACMLFENKAISPIFRGVDINNLIKDCKFDNLLSIILDQVIESGQRIHPASLLTIHYLVTPSTIIKEIVSKMKLLGADVNYISPTGESIISISIRDDSVTLLEYIHENEDFDLLKSLNNYHDKSTPLILALKLGSVGCFDYFLYNFPNVILGVDKYNKSAVEILREISVNKHDLYKKFEKIILEVGVKIAKEDGSVEIVKFNPEAAGFDLISSITDLHLALLSDSSSEDGGDAATAEGASFATDAQDATETAALGSLSLSADDE